MCENQYIIRRRNRKLLYYRLRLGVLQTIAHPILIMCMVSMVVLFAVVLAQKDRVIKVLSFSGKYSISWNWLFTMLVVLFFVMLVLWFVEFVGLMTARKIEADIQEVFSQRDLRDGSPILTNKKRIRGTDVVRFEFYSAIPIKRWIEQKDVLEWKTGKHLVEEIQRSGSKDRMILLYLAPGWQAPKREAIYDDDF